MTWGASPMPPDPYAILGISKDADRSVVRTARRKLLFKHNPDRLQDEGLREKAWEEFQKIQQAYEVLIDPVLRSRYDDRVKLAELRKEAVMKDPPPVTSTMSRSYPIRVRPQPQPAPPPAREFRDCGGFFEGDGQSKKASASEYQDPLQTKAAEQTKKAPPCVSSLAEAVAAAAAADAAAVAAAKRMPTTKKSRSSKPEENRTDREKKRGSREKVQGRKTAYVLSSSDCDDTEVTASPKATSRSKSSHQYKSAPETLRRSTSRTEETGDLDEESVKANWGRHHAEVKAHIGMTDNWYQNREGYSRRSSGRSERHSERRERDRDRDHRNVIPAGLHRYHTTPTPKPSGRDAAPSKGANLKSRESQTHDSGDGSSPHTLEMREESPPTRRTSRHTSSTKYQIEVDEDLPQATRFNIVYDEYEVRYPERPRVDTSSYSKSSRYSRSYSADKLDTSPRPDTSTTQYATSLPGSTPSEPAARRASNPPSSPYDYYSSPEYRATSPACSVGSNDSGLSVPPRGKKTWPKGSKASFGDARQGWWATLTAIIETIDNPKVTLHVSGGPS
ncbi:hypothetical protein LTR72_005591 [Exophiala xenobiotica]|nr:hypothetical protein LTR72_005591 [Exophiala xenobiotica]KAK5297427.1 hypothetical protein LTR14_003158 [Exophiala xenobiotica]KAK5485755.1 hypothetical protein LTR55_005433 [Exophiala xenobiotica]